METYFFDEMVCCKCKRRYSLTFQADSYPSAVKTIRQINYGGWEIIGHYFTLPVKVWQEPIPCGNCTGSKSGPITLDFSKRRSEVKEPFISVKKGNKWVRPDRPESRSKEHKTLIALRNRDYVFTPDSNPINHIQQCECEACNNRKARPITNKSETIGAYNQVFEKLGMRTLSELEAQSIPVLIQSDIQPIKRDYDAEIGIGEGMNYKRPDADLVDEWFDNFTFFWKQVSQSVN